MKALNQEFRKKHILKFIKVIILIVCMLVACFSFTIFTAEQGIMLLENKQRLHNKIFKNQAVLNFKMEELFKKLYSLKNKRRNIGEYKQMQKIITDMRFDIEQSIDSTKTENENYKIYSEFLSEIKNSQILLDIYNNEVNTRNADKKQLEICRQKYQNLNRK